jgi:hypothetical protein
VVSNSIQVVGRPVLEVEGAGLVQADVDVAMVAELEPEGDAVSLLTFVPSPARLTAAGVGGMAAGAFQLAGPPDGGCPR